MFALTIRRAALLLVLVMFAACESTTSNQSATSAPTKVAHTGEILTLTHTGRVGTETYVERLVTTLTRIVDPATVTRTPYDTHPRPSGRDVAVVFTIRNEGRSGAQVNFNEIGVVGTDGKRYAQLAVYGDTVAECKPFDQQESSGYHLLGTLNVSPLESISGCEVFELPGAVKVAKVTFSPFFETLGAPGQFNVGKVVGDVGTWMNP